MYRLSSTRIEFTGASQPRNTIITIAVKSPFGVPSFVSLDERQGKWVVGGVETVFGKHHREQYMRRWGTREMSCVGACTHTTRERPLRMLFGRERAHDGSWRSRWVRDASCSLRKSRSVCCFLSFLLFSRRCL